MLTRLGEALRPVLHIVQKCLDKIIVTRSLKRWDESGMYDWKLRHRNGCLLVVLW